VRTRGRRTSGRRSTRWAPSASILEDPDLTARLAAERVPLTVCPNSNVLIANKVASLAEHPFRRMREAGLLATLNTDDPAMIGLDIGQEYRSVAEALDLSFEDMAAVALDGVEATWLDDDEKRSLRLEFETEIDALRRETA
jgi:adenosine deaminase